MNYTLLGNICNLWRNYGDIQDSWDSVLAILDWYSENQDVLQAVAGPGHWNDPDMVTLGCGYGDAGSEALQDLLLRCRAGDGLWKDPREHDSNLQINRAALLSIQP